MYFCDGVTTPLLGFDAISAASLVIDTEARQIWSKDTVMYENTVPFDTSSTAEPSTFVNSSNISLTTTDSSPSTIILSPSVVDLSTAAVTATTTVPLSSVIDASAATTTSSVVPSETVRLPTRESSEPCNYCSAALITSSSTTIDLDVRQRPFLRRPTLFSLTPLPLRSSLRLSSCLLLSLSVTLLSIII